MIVASILAVTSRLQAQEPPPTQGHQTTPPRLSFTQGEVSFWRPGAEDWTAAQVNTPLASGDSLYSGDASNLEVQIGPRAFLRSAANTQVALDNEEPDFLQFRVTGGTVALDLRSLKAGQTIELDTPHATFSIEATGYYRADVSGSQTTLIARRGGHAIVTPAGGQPSTVGPSEEVVLEGAEQATIEGYAAPEVDAWDRWNYDRTDHLIDSVSARYVPPGVYGVDALDHYGTWRVTPDYGSVWVPTGIGADWAPYSDGNWVWDPYYGWTWVDRAPWGWAPFHYGRWVHFSEHWCWAPGPLLATPIYAPALVAFFGGAHFGVSVGIGGAALGWVSLGWGEPIVPWWGPAGFIGIPSWHGWGGPRVVNNTVIERNTVINVTNINIYQNARVRDAVIAVREDRFGRGAADHVRVRQVDPQQLEPLHGKIPIQPVAASLSPRTEPARRPPAALERRGVVATRNPHDVSAPLRAEGLKVPDQPVAAPRIVASPRAPRSALSVPRAPYGEKGTAERTLPAPPPQFGSDRGSPRQPVERIPRQPRPVPNQPDLSTQPAPQREAAPPPVLDHQQRLSPHAAPPPAPAPRLERRQQEPPPRLAPHEENVPVRPAPNPQPMREQERAPAPLAPAEPAERRERIQPHPEMRGLPGEPANRLYREAPAAPMRVPHDMPAARPAPDDRRDSRKRQQ
ncbi:MAG: hypothetical protein HY270_13990 [Deltaproteobacteria bacterium]|nr:hypothetical protein [Deltaproteobacteria bacterium]